MQKRTRGTWCIWSQLKLYFTRWADDAAWDRKTTLQINSNKHGQVVLESPIKQTSGRVPQQQKEKNDETIPHQCTNHRNRISPKNVPSIFHHEVHYPHPLRPLFSLYYNWYCTWICTHFLFDVFSVGRYRLILAANMFVWQRCVSAALVYL